MNDSEAKLLEATKRWERDRLSREVSGQDEKDEEPVPPAPLSREELKSLLSKRDKGAKS